MNPMGGLLGPLSELWALLFELFLSLNTGWKTALIRRANHLALEELLIAVKGENVLLEKLHDMLKKRESLLYEADLDLRSSTRALLRAHEAGLEKMVEACLRDGNKAGGEGLPASPSGGRRDGSASA